LRRDRAIIEALQADDIARISKKKAALEAAQSRGGERTGLGRSIRQMSVLMALSLAAECLQRDTNFRQLAKPSYNRLITGAKT
jgi:hypothetical protein